MVGVGDHMKNSLIMEKSLLTCSLQKSIQESFPLLVEEENEWHTFWDSDPTPFESIYTERDQGCTT
jgi:hypothetical protein